MRAILLTAALLVAPAAQAHDWYPADCCSGMDCAPVEKVEIIPAMRYAGLGFQSKAPSIMVVTTKHGTVTIPRDDPTFKPRVSKDAQMHACIRQTANGAKLICFFEPPAM